MSTGVPHYCLEVENYNIHRLSDFARLLKEMPSILPHVRASAKADRPLVHFQLNNNLTTSLDTIRLDLDKLDVLNTPFMELRGHFMDTSDLNSTWPAGYYDTRSTWWDKRAMVSLNTRNQKMSAVEKKAAVTQTREKDVRKLFARVCKFRPSYTLDGNSDSDYLHLLARLHIREHERVSRNTMRDKLRPELRAELTKEIRAEVENKVRKQPKLTPKKQPRVQQVRKSPREDLKRELKAELRKEITANLEAEIRAQLLADQQARKAKEKDKYKEELRAELKAELMAEVRAQVEAELREQLNMG